MKARLGQNFLADQNILRKIVKVVPVDYPVIEVGTGEAALTLFLAQHIQKDIQSYEIDRMVYEKAKINLIEYNNVTLNNIDFLEANLNLTNPHVVIANIPYYITSPIIDKCLHDENIVDIYIMVQKEIAERIVAPAGGNDYSSFSIFCQTRADVKKLFNVSKNCFKPKPKVDSAFIRITPHNRYLAQIENLSLYNSIIRGAFWGKRKTLFNCLLKSPHISIDKDILLYVFSNISISENIRGECVNIDTFITLSNQINKSILASS